MDDQTRTAPSPKPLLSILWVFLALNYIYCDLLSLMMPQELRSLMEGHIGSISVTQGFLLFAGISMEIPFLMALLSRVLPYRANRTANLAAPVLMILFQLASLFVGSDMTLHYLFFSAVELAGNGVILATALRWKARAA